MRQGEMKRAFDGYISRQSRSQLEAVLAIYRSPRVLLSINHRCVSHAGEILPRPAAVREVSTSAPMMISRCTGYKRRQRPSGDARVENETVSSGLETCEITPYDFEG